MEKFNLGNLNAMVCTLQAYYYIDKQGGNEAWWVLFSFSMAGNDLSN